MRRMRTNCPSRPQYHNLNVLVDESDTIDNRVTVYFTGGNVTSMMFDRSILLDGWEDELKYILTHFCRSWIHNDYQTPGHLTSNDVIDMLDAYGIDTTDAKAHFAKLRCLDMSNKSISTRL